MKRMRRMSLTKTRKWSMCRAGVGGPQATAFTRVVTTGWRDDPRVLGTCSTLGVSCAGRAPVSLEEPRVAWLSMSFQRPAQALPVWGTYRLSPCLDGTRLGRKAVPPPFPGMSTPLGHWDTWGHGWRVVPCLVNPHACSLKGQASGSAGRSWAPPAGSCLSGSWLLDTVGPLDSLLPP